MAQISISQLPQAQTPLTGLELVPIVQNGVTVQATTTQVALTQLSSPVFTNPVINGSISISQATGVISFNALTYSDTGSVEAFEGSVNSYLQNVLQNSNSGSSASADFIVNNNLSTANTYYGDFGINSSNFSGTGSLNLPNATYLYSANGDLTLGTSTANAMHFVVGGNSVDNITIANTGVITIDVPARGTIFGGSVTISGSISGAGVTSLFASPPPIGATTPATGAFTTLTATGAVTLSPASLAVVISPTGTGTVAISPVGALTINPTAASTINNCSIGQTTAAAGSFTYLISNAGASITGAGSQPITISTTGVSAPISISTTTSTLSLSAGSGGVTITSTTTGTINNMSVGATTASTGKFTTLQATSTITPSTTSGIVGTTLADSAQAGSVGEYLTASSTAVSLTSTIAANATSISLTSGDWDVWGAVQFIPAGTTTVTNINAGVSPISATFNGTGTFTGLTTTFNTGSQQALNCQMQRVNVSATTTIYLVAAMSFGVSTATCNGYIWARRRR